MQTSRTDAFPWSSTGVSSPALCLAMTAPLRELKLSWHRGTATTIEPPLMGSAGIQWVSDICEESVEPSRGYQKRPAVSAPVVILKPPTLPSSWAPLPIKTPAMEIPTEGNQVVEAANSEKVEEASKYFRNPTMSTGLLVFHQHFSVCEPKENLGYFTIFGSELKAAVQPHFLRGVDQNACTTYCSRNIVRFLQV